MLEHLLVVRERQGRPPRAQLMSIKRNIVAGYVGQLYATLIGILLVPLYV